MEIGKQTISRQRMLEYFIYASLWAVIFVAPLFEGLMRDTALSWSVVFRNVRFIIPFFLIFIIHDLSLSLALGKRIKFWLHGLVIVACICITSIANPFFDRAEMRKPMKEHPLPPEFRSEPPRGNAPPPRDPGERRFFFPLRISPQLGNIFLVVIAIGFNTVIKLQFRSVKKLQRLKELEKQHVETELAYLRSQISPHFFMNTLNNIHALIDVNSEKAKETVIELSKLMRFLLYESGQPIIPLSKEVTFLTNFVELMKLRYTDGVDIQMELPERIPSSIQVPPLLLLPFLENAFKHGISYRKPSYVHFSLSIIDDRICCMVKNSNHYKGDNQKTGIGLENVRKRLQILFGNRYILNVNGKEEEFEVELTLFL
jgi:hypothetical protein